MEIPLRHINILWKVMLICGAERRRSIQNYEEKSRGAIRQPKVVVFIPPL